MARIVSIDELKKLCGTGPMQEDDGIESPALYNEFKRAHQIELAKAKKWLESLSWEQTTDEDEQSIAYNALRKPGGWLASHCPPIMYVNEGSSRVAFDCKGGYCLKVAKNAMGKSQNLQEAKAAQSKMECFPLLYAAAPDGSSLLTECCGTFENEAEMSGQLAKLLVRKDRMPVFKRTADFYSALMDVADLAGEGRSLGGSRSASAS